MISEKKKLLIDRLVLLGVLIVGVLAVIFIGVYKSNRELKILDDNCELINYDETLNQTKCEMKISLNYEVWSGYVAVAFYDANDVLLVQDEYYFFADGKTITATISVPGEASSYSILDVSQLNLNESTALFTISIILIFVDIVLFVLFFSSMLLNCKVYDYESNQIIIYAGWCHHYIKVNGEKYDEHNTIATFTPIKLNCKLDDGTILDATISLSNRISLKINDRLYK